MINITINGVEKKLPQSLNEVTLKQAISFFKEHGESLAAIEKAELERWGETDIAYMNISLERSIRLFSFFADCDLNAVDTCSLSDVLETAHALDVLFKVTLSLDLKDSYLFNGEEWELSGVRNIDGKITPMIDNFSKVTAGEFIQVKNVIETIVEATNHYSYWEQLLVAACAFFRKKGEPFSDELLDEYGSRRKLLLDLPLDTAIHVGFFLSNLIQTSMKHLRYSKTQK